MDLYSAFIALPLADSTAEFIAVPLTSRRRDFLAKAQDGNPVFLLHDASVVTYSPSISLKNVSVQFQNTCRVTTATGTVEDQFAVITCDTSANELRELFIRCFAAAAEQLPIEAGTSELNECVQRLLDLFRSLSHPSRKEISGLWAELFVISRSRNISQALKAWHADPFERFDFSWTAGCLEVKCTVKELRVHDFALEQLREPVGGNGFVVSMLLQPLVGGAGVMELAREIERAVIGAPPLRQKLWENVAQVFGTDFGERLDQGFDLSYAERQLLVLAMSDIPTIDQTTDPRVTAIRFRSDLSTVKSSLGGSSMQLLGRMFV